jgi:hypothetical protein
VCKVYEIEEAKDIKALNTKIDSLRNDAKTEFTGLNYRFDYLEKRLAMA